MTFSVGFRRFPSVSNAMRTALFEHTLLAYIGVLVKSLYTSYACATLIVMIKHKRNAALFLIAF